MIFALLFILAFVISLVVYLISNRWWLGSLVCAGLFVLSTISDTDAREFWSITLIFGLPIVVVASILGAYVVELRRGIEDPFSGEKPFANEGPLANEEPSADDDSSDDNAASTR
ncbi:hypothetical protein [Arenicella xantha]|uniref:Uncharacterized protein n=1 Tax=Arenicella xantha TaxID=644221 RepID=A0A395JRW3_9GAMM|nr:hypothetical protein [Arenicella xantha]RBP53325.1 hypothetical protein DFR28_101711 [Arenicella xantha]